MANVVLGIFLFHFFFEFAQSPVRPTEALVINRVFCWCVGVRWNSAVLNETPGVPMACRFCMMCNDIARFFFVTGEISTGCERILLCMWWSQVFSDYESVQIINVVVLGGAIYTYRLTDWRLYFCDGFALSEKSFRLTVRCCTFRPQMGHSVTVNGLTDFREIWYWRYFFKNCSALF